MKTREKTIASCGHTHYEYYVSGKDRKTTACTSCALKTRDGTVWWRLDWFAYENGETILDSVTVDDKKYEEFQLIYRRTTCFVWVKSEHIVDGWPDENHIFLISFWYCKKNDDDNPKYLPLHMPMISNLPRKGLEAVGKLADIVENGIGWCQECGSLVPLTEKNHPYYTEMIVCKNCGKKLKKEYEKEIRSGRRCHICHHPVVICSC